MKIDSSDLSLAYMHAAIGVAKKALCLNAHCGAVIASANIVIGAGYNGPPLDSEANRMCKNEYKSPVKNNYDRTCCLHAEWRAIMDALKRYPHSVKGSKLYFVRVNDAGEVLKSGPPYCTACSRLALDVGIAKFHLWHEEGITAYDTDEYNRLSYSYDPPKADMTVGEFAFRLQSPIQQIGISQPFAPYIPDPKGIQG